MVKYREASPGAAYEIADGVSAEEAAKLGLAVVEVDPTSGQAAAYGRYKDAPKGAPQGVTVAKGPETEVVGTGHVAAPAPAPETDVPTNPDDPVVKTPPGVETIHADNAPHGEFAEDLPATPAPEPKKTHGKK